MLKKQYLVKNGVGILPTFALIDRQGHRTKEIQYFADHIPNVMMYQGTSLTASTWKPSDSHKKLILGAAKHWQSMLIYQLYSQKKRGGDYLYFTPDIDDEVIKQIVCVKPDNSYSSNIVGFENSLNFLKEHKELKVIITPGIVDLGKYTKMINERAAAMLLDIDVILIKNESSIYISNYLDEHKKEYKMFNSFKEAYSFVVGHYQEAIVLIENDLPENYLRG